jgi:hypothetical protein
VTREGVFGLTPGIDLALVAAGQDARRFQLWEAVACGEIKNSK